MRARRRPSESTPSARARAPRNRTGNPERRANSQRRESPGQRRARITAILRQLHATYPEADCALRHASAYQLLVATILSAQCTDVRVNLVTPGLFARYPDARALAAADSAELEEIIRSTGFFRNKARNLIGMARRVCEAYGGDIPATMDDLLTLPGVARKTANCVLGTWFRKNEGIVVDTHVGRLAQRLGLLESARNGKDAVRIERDLMTLIPREDWTWISHALIDHGRAICIARKPRCRVCPIAGDCPSAGIG
ncbi:MAG: endonuclease III [Phycisphaerales bacterium]|nr:endonuclease III [Phycisphaerales bacterium]